MARLQAALRRLLLGKRLSLEPLCGLFCRERIGRDALLYELLQERGDLAAQRVHCSLHLGKMRRAERDHIAHDRAALRRARADRGAKGVVPMTVADAAADDRCRRPRSSELHGRRLVGQVADLKS